MYRSEINLGVDATGFTLVKYYRPTADQINFIRVCMSFSLTLHSVTSDTSIYQLVMIDVISCM